MKAFIGVTDWDWFRQLRREEGRGANPRSPVGTPVATSGELPGHRQRERHGHRQTCEDPRLDVP